MPSIRLSVVAGLMVLLAAHAVVAVRHEMAAAALMKRGAPRNVVMTLWTPTKTLEGGPSSGGTAAGMDLNDDMFRHIDAAGASTGDSGSSDKHGTSLCGGLVCPYAAGICCPGTTHCCKEGYICSSGFPPTCLDAGVDDQNTQGLPKQVRITSVHVEMNGQSQDIPMSASNPVAPTSGGTELPAPAPVAPPVQPTTGLPPGVLTLQNVAPPTQANVNVNSLVDGSAWPPMAAFAPDGTPRAYVESDQVDWLGNGLQRNGTYNIVANQTLCEQQCDALQECAAYRWTRTNGECWLDSLLASNPAPCPLVYGVRNCISAVKRRDDRAVAGYPYPDTVRTTLGEWRVTDQRNWLPSSTQLAEQGGRLIKHGKYNIQVSDVACVKQCGELRYCAVAMFMRRTGECWLSSRVAPTSSGGAQCALRGSVRDCASYIKRKKDEVDPTQTGSIDSFSVPSVVAASNAAGFTSVAAGAALPSGPGQVTVSVPMPPL